MPNISQTTLTDDISEQAALWIVQLSADDARQREQAQIGFENWKRQSPLHAEAALALQDLLRQLNAVRASTGGNARPARAALKTAIFDHKRSHKIKRIISAAVVACAIALPAWLLLQSYTPAYLLADIHTAPGHWETRILSDGSRLVIGSNSAVDIRFDVHGRTLHLVQGEILVDVAHDTARPFLVETSDGSIRALGTRFVVDRQEDATLLSMLESKVEVQTSAQKAAGSSERTIVSAGEKVRIKANGIGSTETVDVREISDAWKYHLLVTHSRPLTDVLDELNRYRRGRILYDREQLRGIDMTVVLPLDDTDRALQLLVNSVPGIRARTLTPYLVWMDKPTIQ